MVLLEFSMTPLSGGESVSAQVARVLDVIDHSGVPYRLTPMGTILEGDWQQVMGVVSSCFDLLKTDCPRISVQMKVDYRAGSESRMAAKTERVQQILGRRLNT